LNFGLSPDFSGQLKVSLSESLSERLSQQLKWPNAYRQSVSVLRVLDLWRPLLSYDTFIIFDIRAL